jgi:hypothetical protein
MGEGILVTKFLNLFNTVIIQLSFVDIKITEEEKCVSLLCYFLDSWDSLVMDIGSNTTTLALEYVVGYILLEEMGMKNMKGSDKDGSLILDIYKIYI